jgi:hypothetical protein
MNNEDICYWNGPERRISNTIAIDTSGMDDLFCSNKEKRYSKPQKKDSEKPKKLEKELSKVEKSYK